VNGPAIPAVAMGSHSETQMAVRWLILMRAAVATLLLVSVGGVYLWGSLAFPVGPFLAVVFAAYALSLASWPLGASRRFAEVQIYLDVLLETALIYVTGGASSFFPFIYLFSILATSIIVSPRRSFVTAAVSVLGHGVLLALVFYRVIPPISHVGDQRDLLAEGSVTILVIAANTCASFVVAYVATHLAEQLRQVRTQALETEASLAELQVLHEDIVQSVSSGLVTFDRDGLATTANRTVELLGGRSPADIRLGAWGRIFQEAPSFPSVWQTLQATPVPLRFQAGFLRADGLTIPVGVSASLLRRGSGEPIGVICSFQDLTDIKRMEAEVREADRLAAVGRLAAGLAHEIRNPIASIRGAIEVLGQNLNLRGTDRRLMEIALRESDRLDGTIAEFLEFSRPKPATRALTDVTAVVDEVLVLLSSQGDGSVRVVREYPDGTAKAYIDPAQLRQAVWNLCRNAMDAMPEGGVLRVVVRSGRSAALADREAFEIAVEDTGPGVPPEHLPHVFEPFYTTKPKGTGLGLAIVHRIVQEHEGLIRVESRPGGGARFIVRLPKGGD
jgi:two-component system sensor histidine kinase PilS (NtrC family)